MSLSKSTDHIAFVCHRVQAGQQISVHNDLYLQRTANQHQFNSQLS